MIVILRYNATSTGTETIGEYVAAGTSTAFFSSEEVDGYVEWRTPIIDEKEKRRLLSIELCSIAIFFLEQIIFYIIVKPISRCNFWSIQNYKKGPDLIYE